MLSTNAAPMCSEVITVRSATSKIYAWDDFDGIINFLYLGTASIPVIGSAVTSLSQWSKIIIVSIPYSNSQIVRSVTIRTNSSTIYTYTIPSGSYLLINYTSSPNVIGTGPNVTRTSN